jgi:hypothetical protein
MPGHRERLGTALLRTGADLRLSRLATARRVEDGPPTAPGRDLALASLRFGARVDTVLLWAGWRLCPRDSLTDAQWL